MSTRTAGWHQIHLAELAVELLRSFGYEYVAAEDLDRERESFKDAAVPSPGARLAPVLLRPGRRLSTFGSAPRPLLVLGKAGHTV